MLFGPGEKAVHTRALFLMLLLLLLLLPLAPSFFLSLFFVSRSRLDWHAVFFRLFSFYDIEP